MSTGYVKYLFAILKEFDIKIKSAFDEQTCLSNAYFNNGGYMDLYINYRGQIRG